MRVWSLVSALAMVFTLTTAAGLAAEEPLLSNVRQLTFEGKRAGEGYFNADGTKLIFQSERDAANPFYQIFLMDLETGDVEQLSPGIGKTTCAWVHPSDKLALYASTHDDPAAKAEMQAELDFRASGKKRRYAWDYDEEFEIYAHDLATGVRTNLTKAKGYDAEGAYSPDGEWIVFASNRLAYSGEMTAEEAKTFEHDKSFMMDIYRMRSDGSDVQRLTAAPGYDGGPFFSSDGKRITWRRFSKDGASAEIFTMNADGSGKRQLTRWSHMSWAPYFHSSGDYLIFASNKEGFANFELYLVDAAGAREPVRVTHTDGFDGLPVFSPDGQRLSWTSKRSTDKTSQIFMADWDDAEARRLLGLDKRSLVEPAVTADIAATAAAIRPEDARAHVERLASEEMEGRLTGTAGERKATAYVASVFEQLGLEPAGDGGGFFQDFPFTAGVKLGGGNTLSAIIGSETSSPVLDTDWRPLAFSRTGAITEAGVVFAGYGITAPGIDNIPDYDSYAGLDVKGKWVLVFRFQPEDVPPAWRRHLVRYSDLAYKASVAKRLGAAGLIVMTGPTAQAKERLVKLTYDAAAGGGSLAGLSISDGLGAAILKAVGKDITAVQKQLDGGKAVSGFDVSGVRIAATVDVEKEKRSGRNVIARLKTGAPADAPVVVVGAHVDHLGHGQVSGSLAREDERGAVHYGADDNASGVAAMVEMAQYLKDLQARGKLGAKRDILFAAWSGEEIGVLGSGHYTERLAGNGKLADKVAAYLNLDMVGHLREKTYLQGTGSSSIWAREIERRNVPVGLSIGTKADPYLPTDSTPFYMKGVPVLNAFTGAHEDYSTPRDRAEDLNYEGIARIARLMAGIARSLARAEAVPDYVKVEREKGGMQRKHLRAYLGTIPAYGQDENQKGVKLQGAVKGAPAEAAGIQNGDILVGLSGVDIETIHDFMGLLSGLKVGEKTEMVVIRSGKRVTLTVVPGTRE